MPVWIGKLPTRLIALMLTLGIIACAGTGAPPADTTSAAPGAIAPALPTLEPSSSALAPMATALEAPARPERPLAAPGDYRIGSQDLLKVEVFGVADLTRSVRVSASGQIILPLIGVVQAAGLTGQQLAAEIAARLAKDYLQNPQVTIFIEEFTSQRVTVTGAVKTPNVFPLKGRTTLLQVIAAAGGPTSIADSHSVRILRAEPGGVRSVLQYDWGDIRDGAAPDPEVQGEDVIQVDTSTLKEVAKEVIEFVIPFSFFAR